MLDRRSLFRGAIAGAGYLSMAANGIEAKAQAVPVRRSVSQMAPNDPQLQALREGVKILKSRNSTQNTSWAALAAIHGTASGFNRCPHGNWYFLPWHRGFILMYERIIRNATGFSGFAMPYWDWTQNPQLPSAFLQSDSLSETRDMDATSTIPPEVSGQAVLNSILGQTAFETFGTTRPRGQNSLDPSWISRRTGAQGELEANPHNSIHGFVGGIMASASSAGDPIFLMHHCNIDRIWALWRAANNRDSTDPLWLDMRFQDHFVNPDGSFYSPRVRDLLNYESLGYSYGFPAGAAPSASIIQFDARLNRIITSQSLVPGIQVFQAENTVTATAAIPLSVPVQVESGLVSAAARRPVSQGAGAELLNFNVSRELSVSKTRVLSFIRDIEVTNDQKTMYRVFVDCDYLSQQTSIADRHYAGTFGFFGDHNAASGHAGHGGHGGHGGQHAVKPTVSVDLTATLERLYGSVAQAPDMLRVQILPVPRGRGVSASEVGTAKPTVIELAFVSP